MNLAGSKIFVLQFKVVKDVGKILQETLEVSSQLAISELTLQKNKNNPIFLNHRASENLV
jgi:hypothetical protein